ncbi:Streptomycin adenylyltransferase [Thalassobacillus cyri]|uniref:Streptomycin adenylyltransferase n=1 Tax=Thalassobacillus cyri TaxID=571932 RepID=A0A1H3ZN62_9BACI|nr:nucleotidyltransferase domain-containing protein [Thalassobacillus cyri]SEA25229.1 Streptomycin adenylyltransferase [Thalassobacillus cyri]
MRQELAVKKIVKSLKKDSSVKSIYLKGSMGRGEHDEHSDVDLYCLVKEGEEKEFLSRRLEHLKVYKEIIFYDDIFIIAPQIIAVYDDWLHIDLFTVTEKNIQNKDFFTVLYDPEGLMESYESKQHLTLTQEEFHDHVLDTVWFLFQYKKAAERGNLTWAVEMLRYVMRHLSYVLLHHYAPDRALLGLKAVHKFLPHKKRSSYEGIYEKVTPSSHQKAVQEITQLLNNEFEWIQSQLKSDAQTLPFLKLMIGTFMEKAYAKGESEV